MTTDATRETRLAAKLRENLRRRKQQGKQQGGQQGRALDKPAPDDAAAKPVPGGESPGLSNPAAGR
jgi:hypothetical protein